MISKHSLHQFYIYIAFINFINRYTELKTLALAVDIEIKN